MLPSIGEVFRRLWQKIKTLWQLAKSERATPREIGWAVGIGVFAGCTPAIGFHGPVALALATLFRKNRLIAWLGSRVSNVFFLPFIIIAEVQTAHRLRTGAFVALDHEHAIDQAKELVLDWCLGTIPVGVGSGTVLGLLFYWLAKRRDARKRREAEKAPPPAAESDVKAA